MTTPEITNAPGLSRRKLLRRGGAIAGAAALLGGTQLAASASGTSLILDVACNGDTFVLNRAPGSDADAPLKRGDTFMVAGKIYPEGTIAQGLSGPSQGGSIGTWICRGWWYFDLDEIAAGALPHVISTQNYLLDSADGLVSDGTEGGYDLRPVIGGHGMYRNARGDVAEIHVGTNDTMLNLGGGVLIPAPNIRFEFQLDM